MGHSIGISESYYKPTEDEVLKDYLKVVNPLTIRDESHIARKEIIELQKRSIDNEYILKARFHEMESKHNAELNSVRRELNRIKEVTGDLRQLLEDHPLLSEN
jgi:hypothetical protein